ncbi:MAG: hypothetical protein GY861_14765 [bacterium]|nr:hypothetical protein [bacterium]
MTATIGPSFPKQFFDDDGAPLAGGTIEFYESGTSTPKNVYTDSTGGTPIGTSITLDTAGRYTGGYFFDDDPYKEIVKDSTGATIDTGNGLQSASGALSDLYVKRDGTTAMTGNWAYGAYNLTGATALGVADGGTVGSATKADAMTIASTGIVTFVDDIKIKDAGTIGNASVADVMTLASTGVVTFKDDILLKDVGTIGNASEDEIMRFEADGDVTLLFGINMAVDTVITWGACTVTHSDQGSGREDTTYAMSNEDDLFIINNEAGRSALTVGGTVAGDNIELGNASDNQGVNIYGSIVMLDDRSITFGETIISQTDSSGDESIDIALNSCPSTFTVTNSESRIEFKTSTVDDQCEISNSTDKAGLLVNGNTEITALAQIGAAPTTARQLSVNGGNENTVASFESANGTARVAFIDGATSAATTVAVGAAGDDMVLRSGGSTVLTLDSNQEATFEGVGYFLEQASASADKAGYGQLWVKNTTPCELWFTDDAGTDTQIV